MLNNSSSGLPRGVLFALGAAALFGLSTPISKLLVGGVHPVMLAGLLYGGSGIGLSVWALVRWLLARNRAVESSEAPLTWADLPWLGGAVFFGGVCGPLLLMWGLTTTPASVASLLLNLEGVATALLAWFVFRENFDRRIALGMLAIVAGGTLLSWTGGRLSFPLGAVLIAGACLCWGIDNNLTQKVSASDPFQITAIKGLVAASVNCSIALRLGAHFPSPGTFALALIAGFGGYGLSLVLFVLALRHIGTARTGAYFSLAPFVGALVSLLLLREHIGVLFLGAGALMGLGVWLHLSERHEHGHHHEPMEHSHKHTHDEHHHHAHAPGINPREPHSHPHVHEEMGHAHPHFPDIHHRHSHAATVLENSQ